VAPGRLFEPGKSGNPGGRPSTKYIREWLAEAADGNGGKSRREKYLNALYEMASDTEHRDCAKAALGLMAYDFGKPVQTVELTGKDGKPIETSDRTIDNLTSEQRIKRMKDLLDKASVTAAPSEPAPDGSDPPQSG